ncbi:AraC family transcriptional regulator [Pseudomonas oryzihabitans]|uniref:AraC family transcriptional regulator n=1 Tax=Pseudomonas oryzihabitans TaxID=47885 RepID=UPI0028943B29|nr:AraC family transcriptional regulator [Pseudomonas oryzihabitans]MDT3718749.1 AraC family transcriptional regulator [Pseudomonas oryzihabitans]
MTPRLAIKRYEGDHQPHAHAFAQLVLPIQGGMELELEGRNGARLHTGLAALVAPDCGHAQRSAPDSRFLVIDCSADWLPAQTLDQALRQPGLPIPPAARQLIAFAELTPAQTLAQQAHELTRLLLTTLTAPTEASAFARLLARVEAQPAGDWSNADMARLAGVGLTRLHLLFHERFGQTPQAWLTDLRLRQAQRWLGDSRLPIAEIALRVGFSDQAALTRAMTRRQGISPAAWRRSQRTLG